MPAGGADGVERSGDDDLTVRRRREQRHADRVPHRFAHLDVLGREAELVRGLARRARDRAPAGSAAGSTRAASTSSSPSAVSISCGSFSCEQPDDERARRRRELLVERGAQRGRARDVVRAVEQHERMPADDLEPPRRTHRREPVGDNRRRQRRADERLGGRERDRRVVGLVRAVQRQEHVGIATARAREVDDAPAERERLREHREVAIAPQHALGLAREEDTPRDRDRSRRARASRRA